MSIKSYRIADPAPQLDAGLLARFARVEAATVGHYLHDRFMRNDLRPLIDGVRIAGTAQTVSIPGPDSTLLYHAMDRVRPGDILVIDRAATSATPPGAASWRQSPRSAALLPSSSTA